MKSTIIKEWLVKLQGASCDLNELESIFVSPFVRVIKEEGIFYLKAVRFNSIQKPDDVLKEAKQLLEVASGAAKLHLDYYGHVEVANFIIGFDKRGKAHKFGFGFGTGRPINKLRKDPIAVQAWLAKADHDKQVADALRFFSEPNWFNLYKIYELIRDQAGDVTKQGWVTRNDLSRFTSTAQSRDSIGDAARHASKKYTAHKEPMTRAEAISFVKNLLQKWLSSLTQVSNTDGKQ